MAQNQFGLHYLATHLAANNAFNWLGFLSWLEYKKIKKRRDLTKIIFQTKPEKILDMTNDQKEQRYLLKGMLG